MEAIELTVTKQIGQLVFQITGKIEGATNSAMTVTITKIMQGANNVTEYRSAFADASEFEDALRKGYASEVISRNAKTIQSLTSQLATLSEEMETAQRLLLNY